MNRYYYCTTPDCPIPYTAYNKFEKPQRCPACNQPLTVKLDLTAFEKDVINNYPYVIAFSFKRMLEEENQMKNLIFTFLNTLKYMALIVATEYFRSPYRDEYLNKLFRDGIAKPYHGTWNMFLTKTIEFLEQKNHSFLIPELPLAYDAIETGKRHNKPKFYTINKEVTDFFGESVMESLDEKDIYHGNATVIRALLFYRNKYDGHAAGSIADSDAKIINNKIYGLLTDLLEALDFLKNYPLLKSDGTNYWSLMGCNVKKEGLIAETMKQDENVWIQDNKGKRLPLLPFLIQQNNYQIETQDSAEIMMIEQFTGERIIFHSPEGKTAEFRGDVLKELNLLFEQKEKEEPYTIENFTSVQLESRIKNHNAIVESELKDERKIIKGIYQRREDAELELRSWVGSVFGLFFLAAEAGTGKTNLLWEMRRQYEVDFRLDTLFIRATRMHYTDIESELKRIFNLDLKAPLDSIPVFQRTQDKPIMILIDGGNENKNNKELLESIPALLSKVTSGSLKIVLSWRANNDNELPKIINEWSLLLNPVTDSDSTNKVELKKIYWLRPMNKIELQGAWNNYTCHPINNNYKVNFSLNDLTMVDRPLAEQLNNPLLLRLFLELFNRKTLKDKPEGFTNIWSLWWNMKTGSDATQNEFLLRLAFHIVESGTNFVKLDTLYEDEFFGPIVRSYEKISPYNRLLNAGILTHFVENNISYISFTIESVFHYALSRYLEKKLTVSDGLEKFLFKGKQWEQPAMFYMWDLIQQGNSGILIEAIKDKNIDTAITAKPLAQALQVLNSSELVDDLLRNADEKEWIILREAVDIINKAQKKELIKIIIKEVSIWISLSSIESLNFVVQNISFFDLETTKNFSKEVDSKLKIIENLDEKIPLIEFLANFYENSGLYQKAIESKSLLFDYYIKDLDRDIKKQENLNLILIIDNIYLLKGVRILYQIAILSDQLCKHDDALIYFNIVLDFLVKTLGNENQLVTNCYNNIAGVLSHQTKFDMATIQYQKVLSNCLKFYGEEHPEIANCYNNIGANFYAQSKYSEAMVYYKKALKIYESFNIDDQYDIAKCFTNIAHILVEYVNYSDALQYYNKALNIYVNFYSAYHFDIIQIHIGIAMIFYEQELIDDALLHLHLALDIFNQNFDDTHPTASDIDYIFGVVYEKKDPMIALSYYQKAYKQKLELCGADNITVKEFLENITRLENQDIVL